MEAKGTPVSNGNSNFRVVSAQVHDDAHPRKDILRAGRVGGAERRAAACAESLLYGRWSWDLIALYAPHQVRHEVQVCTIIAPAQK